MKLLLKTILNILMLLLLSSCNMGMGVCYVQDTVISGSSLANGEIPLGNPGTSIVKESISQSFTVYGKGTYTTEGTYLASAPKGNWLNTGVVFTGGQGVTFNARGSIVTAPAKGLSSGMQALQNTTGQINTSLSKSDYECNGLGIPIQITPLSGNVPIFTAANGNGLVVGNAVQIVVPYCDPDNPYGCSVSFPASGSCSSPATAWTWSDNWRYRHCKQKYTSGFKDGSECGSVVLDTVYHYYGFSPITSIPNNAPHGNTPIMTNCVNGDETKGGVFSDYISIGDANYGTEDDNFNKNGITDTCWNMNSRGLVATLGGNSQNLGLASGQTNGTIGGLWNIDLTSNPGYITYTASVTSSNQDLYLQIQDPANGVDGYYPGSNSYIGGYSVYVSATPQTVNAPTNLSMCVASSSSDNPNIPSGTCVPITVPANGGTFTMPEDGVIWMKFVTPAGTSYATNQGGYDVTLSAQVQNGQFSVLIQKIIYLIQSKISEAQKYIFKNITCSTLDATDPSNSTHVDNCNNYLQALTAALTIYVILYAISFMFGLVQTSQLDLVTRLFKISLVVVLMGPNSWDFFYNNFFNFLINGATDLLAHIVGDSNPYCSFDAFDGTSVVTKCIFSFLDASAGMVFLAPTNILKILAICLTSIVGVVYFIMICYGVIMFIRCIISLIKIYILSFVFVAVLVSIAPIFIPFSLFAMTKHLFDNWMKLLIRYCLEPIIVIAGTVILNTMMLYPLYKMIAYSICYKCAFPIMLSIPGVSNVSLFCFPGFLPWGYDNYGNSGIVSFNSILNFQTVISFLIFAKLMKSYSSEVGSQIAALLLQDSAGQSLQKAVGAKNLYGSEAHEKANQQGSFVSKALGLDKASRERRRNNLLSNKADTGEMAKNFAALPGSDAFKDVNKERANAKNFAALPGSDAFEDVNKERANRKENVKNFAALAGSDAFKDVNSAKANPREEERANRKENVKNFAALAGSDAFEDVNSAKANAKNFAALAGSDALEDVNNAKANAKNFAALAGSDAFKDVNIAKANPRKNERANRKQNVKNFAALPGSDESGETGGSKGEKDG